MKKKMENYNTIFYNLFLQEALLDFSNYAYDEQIDRPIERLTGFNPYNPVGVYTKSWNIRTDGIIQRDLDNI